MLPKLRFACYRNRADEFFSAMKDEVEFKRYNAAALLGVHAAIALADALTVRESGRRAADERHHDAVKLLKDVSGASRAEGDGWRRFGDILARKGEVAYAERYTTEDSEMLKSVRLNVERFFLWTQKNFADLWTQHRESEL
jgi:hypothetical protein